MTDDTGRQDSPVRSAGVAPAVADDTRYQEALAKLRMIAAGRGGCLSKEQARLLLGMIDREKMITVARVRGDECLHYPVPGNFTACGLVAATVTEQPETWAGVWCTKCWAPEAHRG